MSKLNGHKLFTSKLFFLLEEQPRPNIAERWELHKKTIGENNIEFLKYPSTVDECFKKEDNGEAKG